MWAAIRATQRRWPEALCVVYTGDHDASKEAIIKRVEVIEMEWYMFNADPQRTASIYICIPPRSVFSTSLHATTCSALHGRTLPCLDSLWGLWSLPTTRCLSWSPTYSSIPWVMRLRLPFPSFSSQTSPRVPMSIILPSLRTCLDLSLRVGKVFMPALVRA